MHALCTYDYAVVRIVPRVEREEFMNVGVILSCREREFLNARIELDTQRLLALDAALDIDSIRTHLDSIPLICAGGPHAGPIGQLTARERFHWLVAPRSTVIQMSPVHSGRCQEPERALDNLIAQMVLPRSTALR